MKYLDLTPINSDMVKRIQVSPKAIVYMERVKIGEHEFTQLYIKDCYFKRVEETPEQIKKWMELC